MKWFKHITESGDDPDIGAIESQFGFKGYYLFFRTIEIMSKEFDVENPGKNRFDFRWFLGRFSRKIDRKILLNFLDFCQDSLEKRRIIYSLNGKYIYLNCPKLKELADEYTIKLLTQKSGQAPDKKEIKSRTKNKNKNKEERNKNINKDIVGQQKQIIDYFNKTTGQKRSYSCDETNKLISGRIAEGKTFENFKHVIDTKTAQWKNNKDMKKFIRPSTLFRPGNFEDYLNEDYEDPRKHKYQPGLNPKKPDSVLPLAEMAEVYKLCNERGIDNEKFYYKAKKVYPIIKTTWEQSDKNPATFIRLVEGVKE